MGRFGNVLLVAGEPELALEARQGEVVRLYLTNTANTRVFKVKLPGARMKLVGGDSGRCEREEIVEEAILAPSERVILDVLFERAGELALEHHTPEKVYRLASIAVSDEPAEPSLAEAFEQLRSDPELSAEREGLDRHLSAEPDKTLAFVAEMDFDEPDGGAAAYTLPDAPRGRLGGAGPLPELRDEAHGDGAPRTCARCIRRWSPRSTAAARAAG